MEDLINKLYEGIKNGDIDPNDVLDVINDDEIMQYVKDNINIWDYVHIGWND